VRGVTVRSSRLAVAFFALVLAASAFVSAVFVPAANAIGVQVYRTDSEGRKTGTVTNIGNTGSSAFCSRTGIGAIKYGVAICYLPIP